MIEPEPRYYCPEHLTPIMYMDKSNEYVCFTCGAVPRQLLFNKRDVEATLEKKVEAGE